MPACSRIITITLFAIEISVAPFLARYSAQMLDVPQIRGVESVKWGDSRQEVLQELGFPRSWGTFDSGVELTYGVELEGEPASLTLRFVRARGMVAARYQVDLPEFQRCADHFQTMVSFVTTRYPEIVPEVNRLDPGSIDPCEASRFEDGLAPVSWKTPEAVIGVENRMLIWVDGNSDARILVRLGEYGLEMLFLGPETTGLW